MLKVQQHFYHDPVRGYVESLLTEVGLSGLSTEQRADCVTTLMIEAQRRVGLDMMKTLDDDSKEYFKDLMARDATEEEVAAFFNVRIPDHKKRVESSLEDFGNEFRRSAGEMGVFDISSL